MVTTIKEKQEGQRRCQAACRDGSECLNWVVEAGGRCWRHDDENEPEND